MAASAYSVELAFACDLARRAGKVIVDAAQRRREQQGGGELNDKKNRVDLVTQTDEAVERMLIDEIRQTFPTHSFIGEETSAAGQTPVLTDNPTWICDPIDGTTNFVHDFPYVCVSVGFTVNKIPTLGVIYNPFLNQLFSAVTGQGSFLNQSIRLPFSYPNYRPLSSLSDALIGVEWGSDRSGDIMKKKSNSFVKLAGDSKEVSGGIMCHSLRSLGSAALNYCNVACGSLDAYWEIGCHSWDVCAGMVIAKEAGAKYYGQSGKEFEPQDLMKHHYFVIRGVVNGSNDQDRLAKDFFSVVEEWEV